MFLSLMKNSMGRKWMIKNYDWEKNAKNYFILYACKKRLTWIPTLLFTIKDIYNCRNSYI